MDPATSTVRALAFGEFELDLEHVELRRNGERVDIKPKPLRLLAYLAERRGRTVSRRELLENLWDGAIVTDTSLANALSQARKAVDDDGAAQAVIRTFKGHGYRFIGAVSGGASPAAPLMSLEAAEASFPVSRIAREVPRPSAQLPFVGRSGTLERLDAALADACGGTGRIVLLAGEPGIGKTRTAEEFARRAREGRGIPFFTGWCDESGGTPPYWPWVRILRALVAHIGGDSLRAYLGAGAVSLSRILPELRNLWPDLPTPAPYMGEELKFELSASICAVLQRLTAEQPLALVLEDLHRADEPSLAVLEFLAREMRELPLLVIGTYRDVELDGEHPLSRALADLSRHSLFERCALEGLSSEEVAELVRRTAGAERHDPELVEAVVARTAGNPFFVTELARSLAARGNNRQLHTTTADFELPAGLREVILGRLTHLSAACLEILSVASVMGREVVPEVIEAARQLSPASVDAAIEEARKAGVLGQASHGGTRFSHVLTRDAVYREIPRRQRAELHRAVAEAFSKVASPGELDEQAARIARHWEEAREPLEAMRWHERAARSTESKDPFTADRHWRRVRALAQRLPHLPQAARILARACYRTLTLASAVGISSNRAEALYFEGTAIARAQENLRYLVYLETSFAGIKGLHNDFPGMLEHARRAMRITERLSDPWLTVQAAYYYTRPMLWMARFREAIEVCDQALAMVGESPDLGRYASQYLLLLDHRAVCLTHIGRPREALALFERIMAIAREHGINGGAVAFSALDAVGAPSALGDGAKALSIARRAVERAERFGANSRILAQLALLRAKNASGEWADALEAAGKARSIILESGIGREWQAFVLTECSRSQLGLGNYASAREAAGRAVDLSRRDGLVVTELAAVIQLSRAALTGGESSIAEAENLLLKAIELIEETGATTFLPQVSETRAEQARLVGDAESADRHLREAYRLYTEMGALGHARRVGRQLGLVAESE